MIQNIVVVFIILGYIIVNVDAQCSTYTSCDTCTNDLSCGWCMNTVQGTAACLAGGPTGPTSAWCKEWRYKKSQTGNPVGGFPFDPSQIDAYVLNGSPLTIPLVFTVPPQDTLPLDLVVLQDNSGSMGPAINALFKIVPKLINGVIAFQYDVQFGLATFIDNKSSGYNGVEIYRLRNALSTNYNAVGIAIEALAGNVNGNYDNPETGYDAMMYAAVGGPNPDNLPGSTTANCQNFGWRSSARHVAILITDDYPKCTDTYTLLGTTNAGFQRPTDADPIFPGNNGYLANNADCVLNGINPSNGYMDGSYSGEFHPSAAQVADQFSAQKKDIIPIFYTAQTASSGNTGLYSFYTGQKNNVFKRGNQGDLNSATVTLDQLVISTLKDAAATVAPVIYSDPSGFVSPATVTITSNPCCPNYATSSCTGLLVPGCKVYMSVTITRGSTNTAAGDVVVRVPGFGNLAISTIHVKTTKFFCDGCNLAIPNSVVDYCGVCNGKNASCTDCFGVVVAPGSQITKVDACGVCGGDGSSCFDCNSLSYNTAPTAYHYDDCNVCRQRTDPLWNTTCVDCAGTKYGTAKYDFCGVCNGNNACVGCDGVAAINGIVKKVYDSCGICGGDGSSCKGCDGGSTPPLKLYDACGVCGGNSDTCLGCPGNSTIYPVGDPYHDNPPKVDACGVCGGDNSTCYGCDGIRNSTKTYDICGACTDGSTPPACLDCLGLPFGTTQNDACGNCGGKQTDKNKCNVAGTNPAVIAGAVIGATVAATIAAVALFMLYQFKKNPRWYYQDAVDQLEATHQHNPLYESAGTQKDNPLYTGGGK